jgi:hypothetical protein
MTRAHRHEHSMTRVDIVTGVEFEEFLTAFEAAAPAFDPVPMQRIVESGGTWDEVRAAVAPNAPNELMGNHVIAETMFRHDPRTLLYAPLRLLVHSDADGNAVFSMDRPSSAFGSLGIAEVTEVGLSLDRKVANLLRVIGVDPGDAFAV